MLGEFKKFVMRGNLLELAVAFIMGVAFATVVTAFTNLILSFIAAIFGGNVSFNHLTFSVNDTPIPYGAFLTAVVSFLIVAWVLFLLVQAYDRLNRPSEEQKNTKPCDYCQTEIPMKAVRCPNCTSELATAVRRVLRKDTSIPGLTRAIPKLGLIVGRWGRKAGEPFGNEWFGLEINRRSATNSIPRWSRSRSGQTGRMS